MQTIDELLDYLAGVDIRQRGTGNVQADISIRGGSFDQVLVLLNGVNITNPQSGHYNLDIPVELSDISRIEVLHGSSARVLGVNAFSGAINIITAPGSKNEITTGISSGRYNTHSQTLAASYATGKIRALLSAAHHQSDGYIHNTDYNISNVLLHLSGNYLKAGKFGLQAGIQHKGYGANAFYSQDYPEQYDQTRTFFSALSWSLNKSKTLWNAQLYWRQHHDKFELFRNYHHSPDWYTGHNYHQTDVAGGKLSGSYLSAIGKLTLGIEIRNEHIYSNVLGKEMKHNRDVPFEKNAIFTYADNRLLNNLYIDYSNNFNRFYISAGGALNHTRKFGMRYFGGIELGYDVNDFIKLFTSFNSAVRLPTFTDLYYKSATQIANPELKPESSKTFEAGLKYHKSGFIADVSAFYRQGDNIIDWIKEPDSIRWESRNLTNVNALGADVSLKYDFSQSFIHNIKLVYSYLHLNKEAEGFDSKYALDYMKHKCVFSIYHTVYSKLTATWKASFTDRYGNYTEYNSGDLVDYAPYFLLDAKIQWTEKYFNIYMDINNILNTTYCDYGGLPLPGINWCVGVKLKIKETTKPHTIYD